MFGDILLGFLFVAFNRLNHGPGAGFAIERDSQKFNCAGFGNKDISY